ncbi:hypothetical protein EYF80_008557 [Liparis tanakae]|uniref:Uncharacterized protein n=1 Tax=Liparis tanakae TaxID=230148 RepID=A0A4Z2IVG8_9TELE|nr:hypothetical protein EYF80_008557 [Liparis tanakae]
MATITPSTYRLNRQSDLTPRQQQKHGRLNASSGLRSHRASDRKDSLNPPVTFRTHTDKPRLPVVPSLPEVHLSHLAHLSTDTPKLYLNRNHRSQLHRRPNGPRHYCDARITRRIEQP